MLHIKTDHDNDEVDNELIGGRKASGLTCSRDLCQKVLLSQNFDQPRVGS